ncbi:MAG: hypothetical protein MN733_29060, partial [Nitrososphaera sp.]|nr:hypothetical protein [Nitrososphaera sp.]
WTIKSVSGTAVTLYTAAHDVTTGSRNFYIGLTCVVKYAPSSFIGGETKSMLTSSAFFGGNVSLGSPPGDQLWVQFISQTDGYTSDTYDTYCVRTAFPTVVRQWFGKNSKRGTTYSHGISWRATRFRNFFCGTDINYDSISERTTRAAS